MELQYQLHKYWIIALISAKEHLRYKVNYLTEVMGMLLWTGFAMMTWWSLYEINTVDQINGYDRQTMMLYLFGVGIVVASIHLLKQGDKAGEDIHLGLLNNYLVKPIHPILYWFIYDMSRKFLTTITVFSVSILVGIVLFPEILQNITITAIGSTVLFIIIGATINFFLFHCISLLSFWVGVSWGYSFVVRVLMIIATGGLIPLDLLPKTLQTIFTYAPFQFFGYVPIQALLGRLSIQNITAVATQGFLWVAIFIVLGHIIYKRGLKTYGAYGG